MLTWVILSLKSSILFARTSITNMGKRWYYMGIIKYFRKKYWEAAIFRGGRRIPFTCDGLTAVPDSAYALFTEKELEKIYNDRNEFYKKLMQMIDSY